jgi:hypothetical protein
MPPLLGFKRNSLLNRTGNYFGAAGNSGGTTGNLTVGIDELVEIPAHGTERERHRVLAVTKPGIVRGDARDDLPSALTIDLEQRAGLRRCTGFAAEAFCQIDRCRNEIPVTGRDAIVGHATAAFEADANAIEVIGDAESHGAELPVAGRRPPKTPTACCASTFRGRPISRASPRPTSTPSPCGSISAHEKPWASKHQPINYDWCCTDRLNSQG